ncbi:MAG TPA: methyltransferase domain-containing protein [Gemmatimonadaceae bacterium]|nr:methyltransferase domain-containing protein [Gemmatimonadaceae bacterium]
MTRPPDEKSSPLPTAAELPSHEYRVRLAGREWTVRHTGAVLTFEDEQRLLSERLTGPPYGLALWPSAIALAHELVARADDVRGRRVLELGAGTGLPGIVAAALGGRVVQTDRQELALALCRDNGARNRVASIEYRLADWASWTDAERYDWILGADVLYGETMHPHLRRIFETNLAPGGRVLLADPFRSASLRLLEAMEGTGWTVCVSKWSIGNARESGPVGLFELTPP